MKPDTVRVINGKEYRFRLSLRASIDIETELGHPLTELSETPSMAEVSTIVRQTVRDADGRKITNEEWDAVDDLITIVDATDIISELMGASLPEAPAERGGSGKNE
jgi:hypothetical protein